jgi:hypothetical protein
VPTTAMHAPLCRPTFWQAVLTQPPRARSIRRSTTNSARTIAVESHSDLAAHCLGLLRSLDATLITSRPSIGGTRLAFHALNYSEIE